MTTFAFDGFDRQRSRTQSGVTTAFHQNGLTTQDLSEVKPTEETNYTFGAFGEALALTKTNTPEYFVNDGQGNVATTLATNDMVQCAIRYEPWGTPTKLPSGQDPELNPCSGQGQATASHALYRGARRDESLGTYQLGSRTYDPNTASFLSADTHRVDAPAAQLSVGVDPLTRNRYSYVNGDPINLVDPSGHFGVGFVVALDSALDLVSFHENLLTPLAQGTLPRDNDFVKGRRFTEGEVSAIFDAANECFAKHPTFYVGCNYSMAEVEQIAEGTGYARAPVAVQAIVYACLMFCPLLLELVPAGALAPAAEGIAVTAVEGEAAALEEAVVAADAAPVLAERVPAFAEAPALASESAVEADVLASGAPEAAVLSETTAAVHGNALASTRPTTLYQLTEAETGAHLKWGITSESNPMARYTSAELEGKILNPIQQGTRAEMADLERWLTERAPGPLNREPWAGSVKESIFPW